MPDIGLLRPGRRAQHRRHCTLVAVADWASGHGIGMDILSSRILLRPTDLDRSLQFYRDVLGLAIYREFGSPTHPGVVFFLGSGFLEVSGRGAKPPSGSV